VAAEAARQLAEAGLAVTVAAAGARNSSEGDGSDGGAGGHALAEAVGSASWSELAELLTVPELAALLAAHKIRATSSSAAAQGAAAGGGPKNRQQLLAALAAHAAHSAPVAAWLLAATGPVVQLAGGACEAVARLLRLFFLNEGQSLSQVRACVSTQHCPDGKSGWQEAAAASGPCSVPSCCGTAQQSVHGCVA
jgi:hypothetical protein